MFTDKVIVDLIAGKGGNGVVAWRREKYIPKGGPCGGNGGKGGSLILEADIQLSSLEWFRNRRFVRADNGRAGGSGNRQGRNGKDCVLHVPCGTLVKDSDTGEILCDLQADKQRWLACKGGRGGRGNNSFKSPTNRAPTEWTPGEEGDSRQVELELKMIADVGLVGLPNAGKSTLLSALAGIHVKTASYPFTTLQPNISYIEKDNAPRIYIADIPGIIEEAHNNRGLGLEFLRHIERTKLLLFVLDASGIEGIAPLRAFQILCKEIKEYNPDLLEKPTLVVLNKIDCEEAAIHVQKFREKWKQSQSSIFEVSAILHTGIPALKAAIFNDKTT